LKKYSFGGQQLPIKKFSHQEETANSLPHTFDTDKPHIVLSASVGPEFTAQKAREMSSGAELITAISRGVVSDGPGSTVAAGDDCRKKATILILSNYLDLLLIARDISQAK